jgi:hypothetical protein
VVDETESAPCPAPAACVAKEADFLYDPFPPEEEEQLARQLDMTFDWKSLTPALRSPSST